MNDTVTVPREWFFAVIKFMAMFTSGNNIPINIKYLVKNKGTSITTEATRLRDILNEGKSNV